MANYDIAEHWDDLSSGEKDYVIRTTSIGQIEKWASDPDCNQKFLCVAALVKHESSAHTAEVSEDAQYIARNGMNHLSQELRSLSLWDLTSFAWKCWWAV